MQTRVERVLGCVLQSRYYCQSLPVEPASIAFSQSLQQRAFASALVLRQLVQQRASIASIALNQTHAYTATYRARGPWPEDQGNLDAGGVRST